MAAAAQPAPLLDSFDSFMAEVDRYPVPSREEEADLVLRSREGDENALERLVMSHQRRVLLFARSFEPTRRMDLIQEANRGLLEAITNFDPCRGYRLLTYAARQIKKRVREARLRDEVVACSFTRWEERGSVLQQIARLRESGSEPDVAELARLTGVSIQCVQEALAPPVSTLSLDAPVRSASSGTATFGRDLLAQTLVSEEESDHRTAMRQAMERAMNLILLPRETEVLCLRYGFVPGDPSGPGVDEDRTFNEIGARFGITRQAVQLIYDRARFKLRLAVQVGREMASGDAQRAEAALDSVVGHTGSKVLGELATPGGSQALIRMGVRQVLGIRCEPRSPEDVATALGVEVPEDPSNADRERVASIVAALSAEAARVREFAARAERVYSIMTDVLSPEVVGALSAA